MDAMVSARVPVEIKKRGDSKLKEIGSSATELINAAYDYVIKRGELPDANLGASGEGEQLKTLSGAEAQAFVEAWRKRGVLEARGYDGGNFKQILDQARGEYYARLA